MRAGRILGKRYVSVILFPNKKNTLRRAGRLDGLQARPGDVPATKALEAVRKGLCHSE